jgi:very-short-patch-repair endonuclease
MARTDDGAIAELARQTLGLVTARQLDAAGVTRQRRRRLVSKGVLVPAARGVLRHAAVTPTWDQQGMAAVLAAGEGAVAPHLTAACLWRFEGIGEGPLEVTVSRGRQPRAVPAMVHRTLDLGPADVEPAGLPRTTASRTLCDIAPRLEPAHLEAVLDHAERRNLVWRPHLRWRLDALRRSGRPGLSALATLLDRTEGRPLGDSWLEQEAIRVVARSGLPVPRVQVKRRQAGGGIARVDLCWDDAGLIVELAGHATHSTRRDRQRDAERAARLRLAGWRLVEFTYEDVVERPGYVAEMIRSHLDLAA